MGGPVPELAAHHDERTNEANEANEANGANGANEANGANGASNGVQWTSPPAKRTPAPRAESTAKIVTKSRHRVRVPPPPPKEPSSPRSPIPRERTFSYSHPPPETPRRARERPMTRPRIATIPPPAAPVRVPLESAPASPTAPMTAPASHSNRLVYFTVAGCFLFIVVAFIVVVQITTSEIAALREQLMKSPVPTAQRPPVAATSPRAAAPQVVAAAVPTRAPQAAPVAQRSPPPKPKAATRVAPRKPKAVPTTTSLTRTIESTRRTPAPAKTRRAPVADRDRKERQPRREDRERRARPVQGRGFEPPAPVGIDRFAEARPAGRTLEIKTPPPPSPPAPPAPAQPAARRPIGPGDPPAPQSPKAPAGAAGPRGARQPTPAAVAGRTARADGQPSCPVGMRLIDQGSFMMGSLANDPERNFGDLPYASVEVPAVCIDFYEYPNGRGRKPSVAVTWKTAEARCRRRGKRLCSEAEWEKACKGPTGLRYAYGNQWQPNRCNTEDEEGNDRSPMESGSFTKCRSRFGVIDMAGNVAEWTSTAQGSRYVVKGGGADRPGYDSRCAARKRKAASHSSELLGFRCCKDPD